MVRTTNIPLQTQAKYIKKRVGDTSIAYDNKHNKSSTTHPMMLRLMQPLLPVSHRQPSDWQQFRCRREFDHSWIRQGYPASSARQRRQVLSVKCQY